MKKTVLFALVACFALLTSAQPQGVTPEQMQQRRAEMVKRQAERMAKDLRLEQSAKETFISTYTDYRNELVALVQTQTPEAETAKKNLTDEEAKARVEKFMDYQQKEAELAAQRLEVHKKYLEIFSKTLTPQQLAQIFKRQNQMRQQAGGQRGFGGQRGQGGFGGQRGQGGFGGQRGQGGFDGGDF